MAQVDTIRFADLTPGRRIAGLVCLWSCQVRRTKQNSPFLQVELRDASATVLPGVMWDAGGDAALDCPVVVMIEGETGQFQGNLQVKLFSMQPTEDDVTSYVPSTYRPMDDLIDEFHGIVGLIDDAELRRLVHACLERAPGFWNAPAAITFHGAYRGGLLEHTLNVTRVCLASADIYGPRVNRDLLVAAAVLHDIGKSDAYQSPESREPIEDERLIGHIIRGTMLVQQTADQIEYAGEVPLNDLLHALISHHGELEYGAPVEPGTAEALILSCADKLDADATGYFDLWRDKPAGDGWTYYRQRQRWTRRPVEQELPD